MRPAPGAEASPGAQGAGIERDGLPVGARAGRLLSGRGREAQRACVIARRLRVMGHARRVEPRFRAGRQDARDAPVQIERARRRDGLLDRAPRQLVAELDREPLAPHDAQADAFLDGPHIFAGHRPQQPSRGAPAEHRERLEQRAGRWPGVRDARQHRVAHGRRDAVQPGGDDFADEERIATCQALHLAGVEAPGSRQRRDRLQ